MSHYLKLSHLAYVRQRASEATRRRHPRRASRVRAYAVTRPPRSTRPSVPSPRRPLDTAPLDVLRVVLSGLHRLAVAC